MKNSLRLLCLMILVIGFAYANTVKFNSPDKGIMVKQSSPEFTITLKANPTTGYSWFLSRHDDDYVDVIKHKFYPANSKLAGAPGYTVWTFKLKKDAFMVPVMTKITLVYAQPWNKNVGEKYTFRIFS